MRRPMKRDGREGPCKDALMAFTWPTALIPRLCSAKATAGERALVGHAACFDSHSDAICTLLLEVSLRVAFVRTSVSPAGAVL